MDSEDQLAPEDMEQYFHDWVNAMLEMFETVRAEWQKAKIVQAQNTSPLACQFACNDCGNCCNFEQHWVWVYPSDMKAWLEAGHHNKYIPLFLGSLFPVEDNEGCIGYGLPSQKTITEKFSEFIQKESAHSKNRQILTTILEQLHKFNTGFNPTSEYCIYYNPNIPHHCLIHPHRPIQCRTYPHDYPQFTKIVIPPELSQQYGAIADDMNDLPACTPNAFTSDPKQGVQTTDEQREWVLTEKANYIASTLTQDWMEEDISDLLIQIYHKEILALNREVILYDKGKHAIESGKDFQKSKEKRDNLDIHSKKSKDLNIKPTNNRTQTFIEGKRPEGKKGKSGKSVR
jgi:Fe-S-cluster containining protein